MPVTCPHPHCGKLVPVGSAGEVPTRCPHCGLLLRPELKPVPKPRRLPSKSASAATDAPLAAVPQAPLPAAPAQDAGDDDPFGIASAGGPTSPNPYAGRAVVSSSPFLSAGSVSPTASLGPAARFGRLWTSLGFVAILTAISLAVVYYFHETRRHQEANAVPLNIIENPGRNYRLTITDASWVHDPEAAKEQQADLVLRHRGAAAWFSVHTSEASQPQTPERMTKDLVAALEVELADAKLYPHDDVAVAGVRATKVSAEGQLGGETVRRDLYGIFHQGILYHLRATAPAARYADVSESFRELLKGFEWIGDRAGWREALAPALATFSSKRFGYQLRAPASRWRESPDLPTTSRFADLKLIDREKGAHLVVAPRETTDLDGLRQAYVQRQMREFEKVSVRQTEKNLTVQGRPAQRVKLFVESPIESFALITTFVQDKGWVYQIEGRCDTGSVARYEPELNDIVATFEVGAVAPAVVGDSKQKSPTNAEPSKEKGEAKKVAEKTPATPGADAKKDAETKPLAETKAAAEVKAPMEPADAKADTKPAAKPADKPALKKDDKSKTTKRKSLDDL